MVRGERWEGGSGWGARVHPWQIHVDIWQNQYNIVKLNKIKFKNKYIKIKGKKKKKKKLVGRPVASRQWEDKLPTWKEAVPTENLPVSEAINIDRNLELRE